MDLCNSCKESLNGYKEWNWLLEAPLAKFII